MGRRFRKNGNWGCGFQGVKDRVKGFNLTLMQDILGIKGFVRCEKKKGVAGRKIISSHFIFSNPKLNPFHLQKIV